MIVDTSAIMSILRKETDAAQMLAALAGEEPVSLSAGTWVEIGAVTSDGGDGLSEELTLLLNTFSIRIAPVTVEQAHIGHDAYRRFGKGRHRARLNLGDCFSYALAKATDEPLLFKGDDFTHTDIRPAI